MEPTISGLSLGGGLNPDQHASIMLQNIGEIANILNVVAIIIGIGLFLGGLFQLKRYGEMRTMMSQQMSIWAPLSMILAGCFLLILPYTITTLLRAFWGPGQTLPLAYHATGSHNIETYIPVVLAFVRLVGVGAIIRGCVLFSRAGHQGGQPGTTGKAVMHLFGGILCVHVLGTVDLVRYIFDV